ncbi:MAG: hypothetical protein RIR56_383 [Bacteroidota bacterium]|jgi:hypothetical protein
MKTTKEHLANFYIAGFTYYDAPLCFSKLKIGTHLRLKLEKDNKFDARAVAIYYKDFKLGFIPRSENRIFYKLLITGHKKSIDCIIQQVDATAHPENQVRAIAYLKNHD